MKEIVLFQSRNGTPVTNGDILGCLEAVKAFECRYLFIHSELSFGFPNPGLSRKRLLAALLEAIRELRVPTLCVPTFTFSFCNGEDYDVQKSRSKMGALNEYIRSLPEAVRSRDPLLSVVALGEDTSVVEDIDRHSIGEDCTFDKLRQRGGTKFLFLGASPSKCMTYVHFVEERLGVPYRYDRDFTGNITDVNGTTRETYTLFVRYQGVRPSQSGDYEQYLVDSGHMARVPCGDTFMSAIDEATVFETLTEILNRDIDFLLAEPYALGHRDTSFEAHHMVAL